MAVLFINLLLRRSTKDLSHDDLSEKILIIFFFTVFRERKYILASKPNYVSSLQRSYDRLHVAKPLHGSHGQRKPVKGGIRTVDLTILHSHVLQWEDRKCERNVKVHRRASFKLTLSTLLKGF